MWSQIWLMMAQKRSFRFPPNIVEAGTWDFVSYRTKILNPSICRIHGWVCHMYAFLDAIWWQSLALGLGEASGLLRMYFKVLDSHQDVKSQIRVNTEWLSTWLKVDDLALVCNIFILIVRKLEIGVVESLPHMRWSLWLWVGWVLVCLWDSF